MLDFYLKYSWYRLLRFLLCCAFLLISLADLAAQQQQNPDELPVFGTDYGSDFGKNTNYGLVPNSQSFDW